MLMGFLINLNVKLLNQEKANYFKLTIKEQVSSTSDYPLELKFAFKYRGSRKFGTLSS
jgi:hypothetical protein